MDSKLKSRKLWVLILGIFIVLLKSWGVDIDETSLFQVLGLSGIYMVGQGIADHGKNGGSQT